VAAAELVCVGVTPLIPGVVLLLVVVVDCVALVVGGAGLLLRSPLMILTRDATDDCVSLDLSLAPPL
jgi:hypothetical protein